MTGLFECLRCHEQFEYPVEKEGDYLYEDCPFCHGDSELQYLTG